MQIKPLTKSLANFPPYTDRSLQSFQSLYQYISEVWWVKEYYEDSKKPVFNDYQTLDFPDREAHNIFELAGQINHQEKYPLIKNISFLFQFVIIYVFKISIFDATFNETLHTTANVQILLCR